MSNDFTIFKTTSIKFYFDDFDAVNSKNSSNLSNSKDFQQFQQFFIQFTFQQSFDNLVFMTLSSASFSQSIKRDRE